MRTRMSTSLLSALVMVLIPAVALAQTAAPKVEEKPKAPATVAGKWLMTVDTPNAPTDSQMDLKLDGKKVTGTLASQMGETPVTGEWTEGKLTLSFSVNSQNGMLSLVLVGALKEDGTMAGTLDFGQGMAMNWRAARPKGL